VIEKRIVQSGGKAVGKEVGTSGGGSVREGSVFEKTKTPMTTGDLVLGWKERIPVRGRAVGFK